MDKSKHPFLYFGIFTVIIQAVIWALFSLMDYGLDEGHWEAAAELGNTEYFTLLLIPIPIVSYLILNKRYFSSDSPIKNTLFQLVFWCAVIFLMGAPINLSISYNTWIVKQNLSNMMNGLEYILVPIYELMAAVLLLIKLVVHIVIHIRKKAN